MTNCRSPVRLGGAVIDNVTMPEALAQIERLIGRAQPAFVVTPNVDHIVRLVSDAALQAAYRDASLVLADGMPLLWAARFLGTPLKAKVSGSDLMPTFCRLAAEHSHRLFFLGGRPGAAQRSAEILASRYRGLSVQTYCPPMGFDKDPSENRKAIEIVRAATPDVLFAGLGSPKQEIWIHRHYQDYRARVSIGVGASFDFVSGNVRRAPVVFQKTGFEWLWRLALEPTRMYRRYLMDDPVFFALVWRQRRLAARLRINRTPASAGSCR